MCTLVRTNHEYIVQVLSEFEHILSQIFKWKMHEKIENIHGEIAAG